MEQIDFYILSTADPQAVGEFTCRLAEKAYEQGYRVFIRTRDSQQAERLDELLWTFRADSFLPHGLAGQVKDEPILLGERMPDDVRHDYLINFGLELPPGWQRFKRLAEVVEQRQEPLAQARQRFRAYRSAGHPPNHHDIELKA
jgi:DNA polymerase-3 subunit chi